MSMSSGRGVLPSTVLFAILAEFLLRTCHLKHVTWRAFPPVFSWQEIGEIMRLCCRAMMDEFKGVGRAVEIGFAGRYPP